MCYLRRSLGVQRPQVAAEITKNRQLHPRRTARLSHRYDVYYLCCSVCPEGSPNFARCSSKFTDLGLAYFGLILPRFRRSSQMTHLLVNPDPPSDWAASPKTCPFSLIRSELAFRVNSFTNSRAWIYLLSFDVI